MGITAPSFESVGAITIGQKLPEYVFWGGETPA